MDIDLHKMVGLIQAVAVVVVLIINQGLVGMAALELCY